MICLECESAFEDSEYTFFCSQECAADWGDDEALLQALQIRELPDDVRERIAKHRRVQ